MRIHRWMGVAFCVLFLNWFLSGVVMMYYRFPRVDAEVRLSRAQTIDPGRIHITAERALRTIHASNAPSQIRLNVLDGRPVYRFSFGRRSALVFADDGRPLDAVPQEMALRIASAWTGFSASAASSRGLITRDDQWTVYSSVHPYGPFWKYIWPNGEEVYVSQTTGEVVQDTTRGSRFGAYVGAIPHWLYFTWLRSNGALWAQVVVWLSGAGTVMAVLGLIAGVWLYSPSKPYRFPEGPSSIPYVGPKRWHVVLGLVFGAVTCTWVFSGLLSMGPFSWLSDRYKPDLDRALRGGHVDISKFGAKDPQDAITEAASELKVKELEFASFGGETFYLITQTPQESRIIPMRGDSQKAFETERILGAVRRAVSPATIAEARLVKAYEIYYVDRQNRKPLPVYYIQLNDASQSAYYIDPRTGKVVESYGSRSRWDRWLYHGLHSIDIPWLYVRRPAWDIVVILLMLGGTALSITSLLIAWEVVWRKFVTRQQPRERERVITY